MMNSNLDPVNWAAEQLAQADVENARLEAQLLLGLTLNLSRTSVVARTYPPLSEVQWQRFGELVTRRGERVPLAYLRGAQEFYGLEFVVTPDVLVPRPETELLVALALERMGERLQTQPVVTLADVGTGSGCIPIAILKNQVRASALATDLSSAALEVARQNARRHGVEPRLELARADLLTCARAGQFDMIVSNPPYIPTGEVEELQPEVRRYEPRLALDGGPDGLDIFRRLAQQARNALKPGGNLWLEVAAGQAQDVCSLLRKTKFMDVRTWRDLAGIERVVGGVKHG